MRYNGERAFVGRAFARWLAPKPRETAPANPPTGPAKEPADPITLSDATRQAEEILQASKNEQGLINLSQLREGIARLSHLPRRMESVGASNTGEDKVLVKYPHAAALEVIGHALTQDKEPKDLRPEDLAMVLHLINSMPKEALQHRSPLHADMAVALAKTFDKKNPRDTFRQIYHHLKEARKGDDPTSDGIDTVNLTREAYRYMFIDTVSALLHREDPERGIPAEDRRIGLIEELIAEATDKVRADTYEFFRHPELFRKYGDSSQLYNLHMMLAEVQDARGDRIGAQETTRQLMKIVKDIRNESAKMEDRRKEALTMTPEDARRESIKGFDLMQQYLASNLTHISEMSVDYGIPREAEDFFMGKTLDNWNHLSEAYDFNARKGFLEITPLVKGRKHALYAILVDYYGVKEFASQDASKGIAIAKKMQELEQIYQRGTWEETSQTTEQATSSE